jgi:C2H2 type zinc finger protein
MAPIDRDPVGAAPKGPDDSPRPGTDYPCDDCGQPFKTAQGLAGHRRLAHSTSTRTELEAKAGELAEREAAAKRREAEVARKVEAARQREADVARRQQEIADTGPAAIGLSQCPDCRAWFDTSEERRTHVRRVHPIEDAVAEEVGRSRQRVVDVWREAVAKAQRHPNESPEEIVRRFLLPTDQRILRALLAKNATFRPGEG